jgi:hypothetical protein
MRIARHHPGLLALAGIAALALSGGGSATTSGGWQTLLVTKAQGVFPIGWAAGRTWFVVEGVQGDVTLYSARVGTGGLTSVVPTPQGQNEWLSDSFVVGASLVNCCVQRQSTGGSSLGALLANGRLAGWGPLPGDPEKIVQDAGFTPADQTQARWIAVAAATVGGREVWAMGGKTCPGSGSHQCTINGGGFSWLAVCCTAAGEATNLTSLLTSQTRAGATDVSMGVDAAHRLWLAWLDGATSHPGVAFKLVQLDPATLKPVSTQVLDHTLLYDSAGAGPAGSASFAFACSDTCRLVYQGLFGASSWDGKSPPTSLWKNDFRRDTGGHLLGAGSRGGGLDVANFANKVANAPDNGYRLTLEHGDASGRSLHALGSIDLQPTLPNGPTHVLGLQGVPETIFTPEGVVALAFYESDNGSPAHLLGAVLHG